MRAVAQHFLRFGYRMYPKTNEDAVEGATMEGGDRNGESSQTHFGDLIFVEYYTLTIFISNPIVFRTDFCFIIFQNNLTT